MQRKLPLLLLITSIAVILYFLISSSKKSYYYIETREEKGLYGRASSIKEKEPVEILADNDTLAYLDAYLRFRTALAVYDEMKAKYDYSEAPISFKLLNTKKENIETISFVSKSQKEAEIRDVCASSGIRNNYKIINKEKRETPNKRQLFLFATVINLPKTEADLEAMMKNIYESHKNDDDSHPTVVTVFLYTSEAASEHKESWLAMLTKTPDKTEPYISIQTLKFNSIVGLSDDKKSKDEIELEKLNKQLKERNLDLCGFSQQLKDMELDCIHKADKKYPDFGPKHGDYAKDLMEGERNKLKVKYNFKQSDIFIKVAVFAFSYCK
jgi:hypothetical protein